MRKRIQQLARGKFEYDKPLLSFQADKLEIEVLEGKDYTGDFIITSANRVPFRGIMYASNPRMECLTPQFEGEEVRIRYQFHSRGMAEGDVGKGEFFLICNQGEYNLSFAVSVTKLYAETSAGKIRTLKDFARLAQESGTEAFHLFFSPNFKNIIGENETGAGLLYEGLSRGGAAAQKVEEFLLAIGAKKKILVSMAAETAEHCNVTETRKETVELRKDSWGYLEITVRSDAAFLIPGKKCLTEEDFLGSVCSYEYYIDAQALHAGKNYGALYFRMKGKTLRLAVTARRGETPQGTQQAARRQIQRGRIRLMQLYMDYRLKKIVTGVWANESSEILDGLAMLVPDEPLYPLMKAQAKLANRQRQDAAWIMEDFKRECTDKTSPEWGYYRYLCTLVEREPSFVDRVTDEIEEIFRKHPDSSLLFWILLFVRESYCRDNAKRLRDIERWVRRGNKSPYLYLEAYYLIWQDPYLLTRLGKFETAVLVWAAKQEAITGDVAQQVMYAAAEQREFSPLVYRILEQCYRAAPKEEMLAAVCGYLIKGGCFEKKYHGWYAAGIESEIRITGLYEAYLSSMDERQVGSVPRLIQMYFQYNSALSWEQRAVLFVNIIAGKERQPEVYQKYRRMMEQFAMEQLEAGHISDNLAVIYDEMLRFGILNEELAHCLAGVLFTHKLVCAEPKASRAVIYEKALAKPKAVPIVGGAAYFSVYTKDYRVILEDSLGHAFCVSADCHEEAMMNPAAYIAQCMALAPGEWRYLLWYFGARENLSDFTEQEEGWLRELLGAPEIGEAYRAALVSGALEYYRSREEKLLCEDTALAPYMTPGGANRLPAAVRRRMTEFLTGAHLYAEAYALVQAFGYDCLDGAARAALCSYAVTDFDFEEDDFLLGFAESTFLLGKYNDVVLIYLCKYLDSATKVMAQVWKAAGEFGIDTYDLEERILTQMLYTTEYTPHTEQIYESYCAGGGREQVCMAYLSYFAHAYLTGDAVVPLHVFLQLQVRYLAGEELNEACRLGLLKHLAFREKPEERERRIADGLLAEYLGKNMYFSFYRRFERSLLIKYHLYDKYFMEFHGKPGAHMTICFRVGETEWRTEELTEMYDGIYVREFLLFFGEEVQYYIREDGGASDAVAQSGCIAGSDVLSGDFPGRYAALNEIQTQLTLGDAKRFAEGMKRYHKMQNVAEDVFGLL